MGELPIFSDMGPLDGAWARGEEGVSASVAKRYKTMLPRELVVSPLKLAEAGIFEGSLPRPKKTEDEREPGRLAEPFLAKGLGTIGELLLADAEWL